MNEIYKYINNKFDIDFSVSPLSESLKKLIPLYITSNYNIVLSKFMGLEVCLLESLGQNSFTPDQLLKQSELLKEKTNLIPVFTFGRVDSYNVDRYIKKRINFIIPDKILFLPDLFLDIREQKKTKKTISGSILPAAQLLFLYHLEVESLNGLTTRMIADKTGYSYIAINRAINNLYSLGICRLTDSKERMIIFDDNKKELWDNSLRFLQSPIEKKYYTDTDFGYKYCRSGVNALSHYTFLNDEYINYYAIGKDQLKQVKQYLNEDFGNNIVEVWKYNPVILSEGEFIDKLSLYLAYKDSDDERIQLVLRELINTVQW